MLRQSILLFDAFYFLIISVISLLIYFKLRKIYSLTSHSGIAYFKGVFFYFSLTYFFNLIHFFIKSRNLFQLSVPIIYRHFNMLLISYFSTMAVLLILMIITRTINEKRLNLLNHFLALIVSLIAFFFCSPELIVLIQLIILVIILIVLGSKLRSLSRQNLITYSSLILLWFFNLFIINRLIVVWFKIPLYVFSIMIFLSIYLRINKRLS